MPLPHDASEQRTTRGEAPPVAGEGPLRIFPTTNESRV
jgi:hypothetical protein